MERVIQNLKEVAEVGQSLKRIDENHEEFKQKRAGKIFENILSSNQIHVTPSGRKFEQNMVNYKLISFLQISNSLWNSM